MAENEDIFAAIDEADPTLSRSRLARWMRQNHDALDRRLRGHRTVWSRMEKVFADAKLTDAKGNPPNAETARKTWQRIKREVARDRAAGLLPIAQWPADPPPERHQTPASTVQVIEPDTMPSPVKQRRSFPMSSPPKKETI